MKIAVVLGTRPEIVKISSIIRELTERKMDYFIIHTNQHYDYKMDSIFFEDLNLPKPKYNLHVGSNSPGKQTADAISRIEEVLVLEKPDVVLVQGDTNTVLAGALAAVKKGIKIGHVESGLRSYDRAMPEEINRVIVDHISDFLFVPTESSKNNLLKEGISKDKIFITGNTIVDAVLQNIEIADKKTDILKRLELKNKNYILVTCHRAENVDYEDKLSSIIKGLKGVKEKFNLPVIFPIHPRTKKQVEIFKINVKDLNIIEPPGFLDFLELEKNAKLILTDSGGVQEEACILRVPCVTLRENTERPETIEVGSNILAGTNPKEIIKKAEEISKRSLNWKNPFGDGKTANRIINELIKQLK